MQDWVASLEQITASPETFPDGKRFTYLVRHGSMRVGVWAPLPPDGPQGPHEQDELSASSSAAAACP